MNNLLMVVSVAAAVQFPAWHKTTIQDMQKPDPVEYLSPAGSVTNEYKKKPEITSGCFEETNGITLFSLSCNSGKAAGL
jgi:hypothetical protein